MIKKIAKWIYWLFLISMVPLGFFILYYAKKKIIDPWLLTESDYMVTGFIALIVFVLGLIYLADRIYEFLKLRRDINEKL